MLEHETAGDPISGFKWASKALRKLSKELKGLGIQANKDTVAKILKEIGYSLRANYKKLSKDKDISPEQRKERNEQFLYIKSVRRQFFKETNPSISVDTKKKEPIGKFKNPGKTWNKEYILVYDHDFFSYALGIGIPYGIYETETNLGTVFVGTSHDTSAFAVDCIYKWWHLIGRKRYCLSRKMLILADGGGSNGYRSHAWKYYLYKKLCKPHKLSITVCHFPAYASKWNPIERRLFSEISKNWKGEPLISYEKMLNFIQTTKTNTGLRVKAYMHDKKYERGEKITDEQIASIPINRHKIFPQWNYTILPK